MFTRSLTEWTLQQKLKHSDPKEWDVFGNSIAISGETIITGTGGTRSEKAYVFVREGTTWTQKQKLVRVT